MWSSSLEYTRLISESFLNVYSCCNDRVGANTTKYILGGYRINNRAPYGIELALLASIILAGSSIPRAIKSGKPLPIGLSVLATFGLWTFGNAFSSRSTI